MLKHFMALLEIIFYKKQICIIFSQGSKLFFDILNQFVNILKIKLGITSIRYRYRGEEYNKSRLLYFTKSIEANSLVSFLKDNLFNFYCVCCYYSTRYINADKYVNKKTKF